MKEKINVLIVDDHQMILEGIRNYVEKEFPQSKVFTATNHKEIVKKLQSDRMDVLLLDLILNKEDSRHFIGQLIQIQPEMKIIVISSLEDENVVHGLVNNGVNGFVGKSSSTTYIAEAIKAVLADRTYIDPLLEERIAEKNKSLSSFEICLTRREKEVLKETLKERRIKEIAEHLFISEKTVENHRSNLFTKFGVSNVTGLVKKAMMLGYYSNDME